MSSEFLKRNRIKFKSSVYKRRTIEELLSSDSESKSYYGEDEFYYNPAYDDILSANTCYHPKCSFAYSIRRENLRKSSLIAECVPISTYQRLAKLWGLDPEKCAREHGNACQLLNTDEENEKLDNYLKFVERDLGIQSEISEDVQVEAESIQKNIILFGSPETKENPYLKFLRKDGARQSTKSNLRRKAKKITEQIIQNFLDWYQSLGGNDGEILLDESTLQELFQIGFDMPEAKALVIRIKELPTVPECLALLRNEPKHATRYELRQILKQDIRRENRPPKMFAFGSMLPKENPSLRYKPPTNFVQETWMECSRVPKDLDTMKTIWVGLEKLRSTIAFVNWLKDHPQITPPTYLEQKGLLKINYDDWNQMYKGFEVEVDATDYVSSDTKIFKDKTSGENLGRSSSSLEKSDSSISY